jgi:hypothetical protein
MPNTNAFVGPFSWEVIMNDPRSLTNSRRRFLVLGLNVGFLILAGCGDSEVGSVPPVGKSRKETLGDGPLNETSKPKDSKPKR